MAANAIESSILKYSAKEYFFKAALCHMCVDVLEAQRAVEKYRDMHAAFQDTRECKLLKVIMIIVEPVMFMMINYGNNNNSCGSGSDSVRVVLYIV